MAELNEHMLHGVYDRPDSLKKSRLWQSVSFLSQIYNTTPAELTYFSVGNWDFQFFISQDLLQNHKH